MKVSIIIPLYNKAPYVRRALDSIAAQTFADFEAIVVDDGSTDDGAATVADYPDARFRLIRQANTGPGAARNAGLAQARGELIAFLDADDEWLPNYLHESVRLLESFGSEVASVTCGYIEYPSGASMESMWRKRGLTNGVQRVDADTEPSLVVSMLAYMSPCSTLTRAEVTRKWGGFYDREKCAFGEDAFLWLKVLLNERVAFNLKPLAQFHREASGLGKNLNGSRPVEPFLEDASEIEAACPPPLRDLLRNVLAIRAAKTACVLGYWGHWREARSLMHRFTSAKNWRLPYHASAVVCSTPVGSVLGASWRVMSKPFAWNQNGHSAVFETSDPRLRTPESKIKILAVVEATTVNAVAKNMFEFHRAANELAQQSADSPVIELSLVTFDRRVGASGAVARPSGRAPSDNEFVVAARDAGIEVDVIPERGRFDRSVIRALRKIVERRSPDIIVTHQVKSHFLMKVSGLWRGVPWVAFNHGYTTTDRKMLLYNRLDRWSLRKAERVVTVCNAFAQRLVNMGVPRERIHVQHNSIRPGPTASAQQARALRKQLGIKEDERMILAVGRLSKEKAQIDLLRAFKNLNDTYAEINARLVIVGDGPEREPLEAAAASLRLSDRVVFTGQVNSVQVYYAAADVLVSPSHSEGSPYVLLEAMAAGLPIVATAVGGVPEMVENNESALLVPASNPLAMADAIARVLSDEELARGLSANASALVTKRFSPETYARSLVQTYREVINRRT
ncbi:MAG TPA: glycosyltransferase [Pyrinomonadaceae bacterium]|nr:glycosyltransferase [Pyrinomonadaceae bacterium]